MTPTIFLVILCLGVASAAIVPDAQLDVEFQEQKDKEVLIKAVWGKFMKTNKLHNSENDQEMEGSNIEMSASGQLTDEELMKIMTTVLHPMFKEEQNKPQPVGHVPEFEDYAESGDGFFVPNQPR
ncbi:trophoblast-specific protein alpha [Mus caroli]|uniref:Trophoblast-specific protein alpha n=1 Tax=Mus caroli TaxID=10089 RepID=A0A6P5QXY0_MUSCR|nr:trophoblast-specific protein alpha [Mus caroli]